MQHSWTLFSFLLLGIFLIGIVGAALPTDQNGTVPTDNASLAGISDEMSSNYPLQEQFSEMTTFVKDGVLFAKSKSKDEALTAFNDKNGDFVQGERYLFAYDFNGTTLALPYQPEIIGTNRINLTDSNGMKFIQAIRLVAGYGGGYLYYVYPNPEQHFTDQIKVAYVEPVDDTWFIGSGIYLPHIHAVFDTDKITGLKERVEQAARFGEDKGKFKASVAFNDRNDTWAKDNTYIFAYDFNGTTLAMPYQPESIGTDRLNYTDIYGSPIARLEIDTAKSGGGFVYVVYYNPESGRDELKLCYMVPVQDDWMVGSGMYTGQSLADRGISS